MCNNNGKYPVCLMDGTACRTEGCLMMKPLLFAGVLAVGVACSGTYTPWRKNIELHGIRFEKLRYSLRHGDTATIIGYLAADTEIDGIPCRSGWLHFTPDWEPKLFCLSRSSVFGKVLLPENAWILADRTKRYFRVVFPADTVIRGFPCKGGGGVKGVQTSLYRTGALRSFFPPSTMTVDGIRCRGGLFHAIVLHENGKLRSCTCAEPAVVDGISLKKNTVVHLDSTGKICHDD